MHIQTLPKQMLSDHELVVGYDDPLNPDKQVYILDKQTMNFTPFECQRDKERHTSYTTQHRNEILDKGGMYARPLQVFLQAKEKEICGGYFGQEPLAVYRVGLFDMVEKVAHILPAKFQDYVM